MSKPLRSHGCRTHRAHLSRWNGLKIIDPQLLDESSPFVQVERDALLQDAIIVRMTLSYKQGEDEAAGPWLKMRVLPDRKTVTPSIDGGEVGVPPIELPPSASSPLVEEA